MGKKKTQSNPDPVSNKTAKVQASHAATNARCVLTLFYLLPLPQFSVPSLHLLFFPVYPSLFPLFQSFEAN